MITKILSFINKARSFLQGKKTYLAAAILLLQALMGYIEQSLALSTIADLFNWLKTLPTSESTMQLASALGLFGIRAAMSSSAQGDLSANGTQTSVQNSTK